MKRKLIPLACWLMLAAIGGIAVTDVQSLIQPGEASAMGVAPIAPLTVAGSGFTYQGRLLNGGSPVTGNHDFTFKLFTASAGGVQAATTLTVTNQLVTNGIFTVPLDFGNTAFLGDARWLEIAVRPASTGSFTTLSPRQAITPAPYALSAPWFGTNGKPTGYNPLRVAASISAVDAANGGSYTAVAIGADGLPIIAYQDTTNLDLRVAHCNDVQCDNGTTKTVLDATNAGYYNSITIGADGLAIISYQSEASAPFALKVAHCENIQCTASTITTLDNSGSVGYYTSITINRLDHPLISYYDNPNGNLKLASCNNAACTSFTIFTLDSTGLVGSYTSITLGDLGLADISYYDATTQSLKIAFCANDTCSSGLVTFATLDGPGNVDIYTSIARGRDGFPIVSFLDNTNLNLKVVHCNDDLCASKSVATLDSTGSVGQYNSIAIGSDGLPIISYDDATNGDLKVAHCTNASCTGAIASHAG